MGNVEHNMSNIKVIGKGKVRRLRTTTTGVDMTVHDIDVIT